MLPSCDLVIAGAGPAGLSAAINAASEGLTVSLIDPGSIGGQARWSTAVENLAGFPHAITGRDYAERALRQARKFGTKLIIDHVDTFCPLRDGTIAVQLQSARMIECRALVIATGLTAKPLPLPYLPSFGVFTGANPDELPRYTGKRVAIVGAGNSAGQAAIAFARIGAKVTLYARRGLAASMSSYLVDRLRTQIDIREHTAVASICRDGESDLRIGADTFSAVFSFVGAEPSHAFPVAITPHAYIVAPTYATSVPHVYAIGDVRADSTKRIAAAVGEGSAVVSRIHLGLGK